ncbi:MAG TPA: hypothetical protein VJW23_01035 [Propionibacteriaceae bacterium]|nr:hypothetical protein [Propionibacteriaceae bacterium]
MRKPASQVHPQDLETGDRVTIADGSGSELTGLVRCGDSDNQLERWVAMNAFGKEIKVASWKAGTGLRADGKWTSTYPVIARELSLF